MSYNIGSNSIDTPFLRIRKNCLEIQNTTIQISNISLFSTADIAPEKFPMGSVAFILIGLLVAIQDTFLGLVMFLIGVAWIYYWYSSVQKTKQLQRLTIVTNSGNIFPIMFNNRKFLAKVVEIMTDIIRDPAHAQNISINVNDCTFSSLNDSSVNVHDCEFFDNSSAIGNLYEHKEGNEDGQHQNN